MTMPPDPTGGLLSQFATGGAPSANEPGVYMGGPPILRPPVVISAEMGESDYPKEPGATGVENRDWSRHGPTGFIVQLQTQEQAINSFFGWSIAQKDDFRMRLALTGNQNAQLMNDSDLLSRWAAYVKLAAQYAGSGKALTPWELMNNDIASRERAAEQMVPKTETTTSTRFDLSSAADAEAIFYQSARTLLGRAPTEAEVGNFQQHLNALESQSPITQRVERTTSATGETTEEVVSQEGGVGAEAKQLEAMKGAQASPEYGAYQASTTYMNAFKNLIFGKGY